MAKRQKDSPDDPLDLHDETIVIPPGETRYVVHLNDEEIELLAKGICSERLARVAYQMLGWKRSFTRSCALETADAVVK